MDTVYTLIAKGVASIWLHDADKLYDSIGLDVDDLKLIHHTLKNPLIHMIMTNHTRPNQPPFCSALDALLITLHQLRHNYTQRQLASYHHMSKRSIASLLYDTIDILYETLVPLFINTNNMAPRISEEGLLHNVRLAIDCSHTPIRQPKQSDTRRKFYYHKSETHYAFNC